MGSGTVLSCGHPVSLSHLLRCLTPSWRYSLHSAGDSTLGRCSESSSLLSHCLKYREGRWFTFTHPQLEPSSIYLSFICQSYATIIYIYHLALSPLSINLLSLSSTSGYHLSFYQCTIIYSHYVCFFYLYHCFIIISLSSISTICIYHVHL